MAKKRFYINGKGPKYLSEIANDAVSDYANNNPSASAKLIRDIMYPRFRAKS